MKNFIIFILACIDRWFIHPEDWEHHQSFFYGANLGYGFWEYKGNNPIFYRI